MSILATIHMSAAEKGDYRNGTKRKNVRSRYGEFEIDAPQDRNSSFEPQVVQRR